MTMSVIRGWGVTEGVGIEWAMTSGPRSSAVADGAALGGDSRSTTRSRMSSRREVGEPGGRDRSGGRGEGGRAAEGVRWRRRQSEGIWLVRGQVTGEAYLSRSAPRRSRMGWSGMVWDGARVAVITGPFCAHGQTGRGVDSVEATLCRLCVSANPAECLGIERLCGADSHGPSATSPEPRQR